MNSNHDSPEPASKAMRCCRPILAVLFLNVASICLASAPSAQTPTGAIENVGKGWIATIPFAKDGGNSIFLWVAINGQTPGWWAVDSGSSECIVDRPIVRQLGPLTRGSRQVHGAGKGTVRLDSIKSKVRVEIVGHPRPTCDHFAATNLNSTVSPGYRAIAGILGYEFFSRYVVRIDFHAHALQLYDPARFKHEGRGDTVALRTVRNIPYVEVRIRTARRPEMTRELIVDTGSEDAVDDSAVRRPWSKP